MRNCFRFTVLVLSSFFVTSCATIVGGTSQTVSIDSNVKGADITVNGASVGQTPFAGSIKRGKSTSVNVKKSGYLAKTIILNTEVEPIFWGNIIFGGFLGSTTDLSTEAMYKYTPASINVDLEKEEPAAKS